MDLVDEGTHTHHERHEINTCPINGVEDEIQQVDSFERGEALATKETCEEGGMKFDDCDEDVVLSALTKTKVKSRSRIGGIDGNQGKKKAPLLAPHHHCRSPSLSPSIIVVKNAGDIPSCRHYSNLIVQQFLLP
ncbi:hypothetical protein PIB30_067573 [Stylosanthes scabra]|uniref:Uncharacterized protein n=1 Tax=Stylosanthes scabra TaxID=79078 RepID=A0ABU6YM30_9FABA|nr:hypothetical protein [Stylosanthes scabra]